MRFLEASPRRSISSTVAVVIVVLVVALAGVGIYAYSVHGTVTQYVTQSGSRTFLTSAREVIPSGDPSISFTYNIPIDGYLNVSYVSTTSVHWTYTYGLTSISTPSSETETGLTLPVLAGTLMLFMDNDNCCKSDSATVTITYSYA